jgi:uncharacterized phage protein (TIGR01671 family)
MRKIKFRAWDTENKVMIYDIQNAYDGHGSATIEEHCGCCCSFNSFLDVENYIVEQFTGLHDKNRKEIYEGDIVRAFIIGHPLGSYTSNEVVVFECGCFFLKLDVGRSTATLGGFNSTEIEIIGNIHENPELLEGE